MSTIRQGMGLELTPMLKQLNCGDYSSCHECLEENPGGVVCPPYVVKYKSLTKDDFTQKGQQPDDMFFS